MNTEEVARPARSLSEVLRRRALVAMIAFFIVLNLALTIVLTHKAKYGSLSHVVLVSDPSGRDSTDAAIDMPTIATGSTVLQSVQHRLKLTSSLSDLRKSVTASVTPKSSLMTIAVQNRDPNAAIRINNAIAEAFVKLYWSLADSRYDEVTRRLESDLATSRSRLSHLERRLETASAGVAYVGSQASLDASAVHLGELEESRGLVVGQLVTDRFNVHSDHVRPTEIGKAVRHEILVNNIPYRETEAVVGKDLAQFTTTRSAVKSTYPGIDGYENKIYKEKQALNALRKIALASPDAYSPTQSGQLAQTTRDEAAFQGDEVKLAAFDEQINRLRKNMNGLPTSAPSLGALRAERDAAEAQLQALALALTNAQASRAEARSLGDVVIVDQATEARATLVGRPLLLVLGLICAIFASIAAAYLAELVIPRFIDSDDVESVYGRPILASLRAR